MIRFRHPLLVLMCIVLAACAGKSRRGQMDSGPTQAVDTSGVADAVPRVEPRSAWGNPKSYVVNGHRYHVLQSGRGFSEEGVASWYGQKFHGKRTSSGETYNMYAMTAAHRTLPLPTYARVTNLANGRSVVVKINDRGPFRSDRRIDLSYAAAKRLGYARQGTARVRIEALDPATNALPVKPPTAAVTTRRSLVGTFVQVGAFGTLENAILMEGRLQKQHYGPIVVDHPILDGQLLYRLRIGPLADVQAARDLARTLRNTGLHNALVVPNPTTLMQ